MGKYPDTVIITKNWFKMSILAVLVVGIMIMSGCTSQSTTTTTTLSSTTASTITTTAPIQSVTPASIMTTRGATIITTQTPANSGVSVTINSAVKKTQIGTSTNLPGHIFVVLDVTIQNNDKNNDFKFTDSSFAMYDKLNKNRRTAITSQIKSGLNNPLSSGTIPLKSSTTGQIVFGEDDNSSSYKLYVSDSTGTVLTTIDNINVP